MTGSDTVRRSDPDGYTLCSMPACSCSARPSLPSCPYDPQTDFRAIAQAGEAPLVLLCNNNVPGTDYASTMAAIAKEPKKYFFALSSGGSAGHIATLAFLKRTGLPLDTISTGHGAGQHRPDGWQRPALHGSLDGLAAARHLGPGARLVRDVEGTRQLAPNIPTSAEVRPDRLQPELVVRRVGAKDTPSPWSRSWPAPWRSIGRIGLPRQDDVARHRADGRGQPPSPPSSERGRNQRGPAECRRLQAGVARLLICLPVIGGGGP